MTNLHTLTLAEISAGLAARKFSSREIVESSRSTSGAGEGSAFSREGSTTSNSVEALRCPSS